MYCGCLKPVLDMHCCKLLGVIQHDIDVQGCPAPSQGEFQLSKFQDGVLPAAFMVGLLVASLVFSELCKHYNAFRLIGELGWQSSNCNTFCSTSVELTELLFSYDSPKNNLDEQMHRQTYRQRGCCSLYVLP